MLAQQAAEVCPTRSIGNESRNRWRKHHPVEVASGIWRTGSNSAETAGGNAFVVPRSSGGLLIDAPRSHRVFARTSSGWEVSGRSCSPIEMTSAMRSSTPRPSTPRWSSTRPTTMLRPSRRRLLAGLEPVEVASGVVADPDAGHTRGPCDDLVDDEVPFTGDSPSWIQIVDDLWAEQFVAGGRGPTSSTRSSDSPTTASCASSPPTARSAPLLTPRRCAIASSRLVASLRDRAVGLIPDAGGCDSKGYRDLSAHARPLRPAQKCDQRPHSDRLNASRFAANSQGAVDRRVGDATLARGFRVEAGRAPRRRPPGSRRWGRRRRCSSGPSGWRR